MIKCLKLLELLIYLDFEKISCTLQQGLTKKYCESQLGIFLINQNIMIQSSNNKYDECSSSAHDSYQSSPPGDCPPIVNCSKSQI